MRSLNVYCIFQQTRKTTADAKNPTYWESYMRGGVQEAGHSYFQPSSVDWVEGLRIGKHPEKGPAWRSNAWQMVCDDLLALLKSSHIDLVLCYLFPEQIDVSAIRKIRSLGIPIVNFFCDNEREFRRVPEEFREFDLSWVPESGALAMYRAAGLAHVWAPMPCYVSPEYRNSDGEETLGITFIGQPDRFRRRAVSAIVRAGIPLTVLGSGWRDGTASVASQAAQQPPNIQGVNALFRNQWGIVKRFGVIGSLNKVSYLLDARLNRPTEDGFEVRASPNGSDYLVALRNSQVTLGVNRYEAYWSPVWWPSAYSRLRDVEAPMSGACYLTEWTPDIDRLYEPEEVTMYRSDEEMIEKLAMLMRDSKLRRSMREKGQRAALGRNTIGKAIAKVWMALKGRDR